MNITNYYFGLVKGPRNKGQPRLPPQETEQHEEPQQKIGHLVLTSGTSPTVRSDKMFPHFTRRVRRKRF